MTVVCWLQCNQHTIFFLCQSSSGKPWYINPNRSLERPSQSAPDYTAISTRLHRNQHPIVT